MVQNKDLQRGLRAGVQRIWQNNLASCSGPSETVHSSKLKMQSLSQSWVGAFPDLPPKGLEQWFRVKVLSEGLEEGFRMRFQRTMEIPFGRLLQAFRKSAQFKAQNTIFEPIRGDLLPGIPPGGLDKVGFQSKGLEQGFRIMVQRNSNIQVGKLLWAFRKSAKFKAQNTIFEPIQGDPFPGLPPGCLEQGFRIGFQSKGFKQGFKRLG